MTGRPLKGSVNWEKDTELLEKVAFGDWKDTVPLPDLFEALARRVLEQE